MTQLLTVEGRVERGVPVLRVGGELERCGSARVLSAIRLHHRPGAGKLILDMSDVERISASALAVLSEIHHSLALAGCQLILACAGMQVKKMLVLSFLDKVIRVAGSIEEAVGRA
jgi:anti-anti-sigma factor